MVDTQKSVISEEEKKNPDQEVKQEKIQAENKESPLETQEQIHWRKFREEREKERKQRIVLEEETKRKSEEVTALKQAMEAILSKPAPSTNDLQGIDLSDEERIKNQVRSEVEAVLASRDRELERQRQEREAKELPQKLNQTYSDFNEVCSTENLDYLEFHYPEIADAFKNQSDSFNKWANIYKAVKRFIPNSKDAKKEKAAAERNLNKPQSMNAVGMASTGDVAPHKLDDQRRADNWARMQRIMKGL
jgi:hypothetical protein